MHYNCNVIEAIKKYKQNMRYFSRQEEIETDFRSLKVDNVPIEIKDAVKDITEIPDPDLGQHIDLYA